MNNSRVVLDNQSEEPSDRAGILNQQKGQLAKIVEAIRRVESSEDWQSLKELVFDSVIETLERQLKAEAQKPEVVTPELYRLQGQLVWARKYADLEKLAEFFVRQIEGIKVQLKNDTNHSADGAA